MDDQERLAFYAAMYEHDATRRDALSNALQVAFGFVPAVLGLALYAVVGLLQIEGWMRYLLALLSVAGGALLVAAVVFLVRAWCESTAAYLPGPRALEEYYCRLAVTHENAAAQDRFRAHLIAIYGQIGESNALALQRRGAMLHIAKVLLWMATGILSVVAGVVFVGDGISQSHTSEPVAKETN